MKKFWNMVLVAMVAMGAAACTNDQVESVGPTEEGVSFYAEFVNNDGTRAYIDDANGDKTWDTIWEQGDALQVSADGDNFYNFEYDGEKGKFTCNTEGVTSLVGQNVTIVPYLGGNLDSKAGKKAWNCEGTSVDNFANSDEPVQLTANTSFLRYTYNGDDDVTFSIKVTDDRKVFVYDKVHYDEVTISGVKGENFVAFWTQSHDSVEATLSYSIDGVECKTANLSLASGKIYNLGTLEKIDRVYLAPGEWDKENAWFAAYFYKNAVESVASASATRAAVDANEVWVKMTDNDGDGTYECIVPEGFPNVVFCRMNSADTETMSFDNAWNQTVDIAIDTTAEDFHENNSYYITSWGNDEDGEDKKSEGAWGLAPDAVVTPDQTSTWSLAGDWDGTELWSDKDMVTTEIANLYVLKNVALEAYSEFKVRKDYLWDESYGGGYNYINANNYVQLYNNGQNVSVTESGNYDIYFHSVYKLLYVVTAGADYTTATWQEANGQGPAVEAPEFTDALVYLVPDMWAADGAWFSAHFFNAEGGAVDVKMTDEDADGIYECNVPVGMESVIFCRMNPAYDEFSWDDGHVWTQGANLTIGVAPNNYYYITDWETGEWNVEGYDPNATVPSTPGEESEWALYGDWNKTGSWSDTPFITTATSNIVVVEDVELEVAQAFLVRKPTTEWADKYGAGNVNYIKANSFITAQKDGGDICVEAAGTYDIYFDVDSKKIYIMSAGADYTTATEQTANGKEPENEEPEVTADVLYLKPNANWKVDNARFAAYFFNNSGNVWVSMADSDSDGIYEVNIPAGYKKGENVIFCRMNPGTTANNWNNKWNQTADLTIPTDDKNLYTVADGTWDKGGGEWSTK